MGKKKDKKLTKECNKVRGTAMQDTAMLNGITYAEHFNKWRHWVLRTSFGKKETQIEREE